MSSTLSRRFDAFAAGARHVPAEPMSWHDSSWDLRQGLEVAELTTWPHELAPAANAAQHAAPAGAGARALRPTWDRLPTDQVRR
jgi:hypothetical protein